MYIFICLCFLSIIKNVENKSFHFLLVIFLVIVNSPVSNAASNHGPDCEGVPSYGVRQLGSGFAFVSFQ